MKINKVFAIIFIMTLLSFTKATAQKISAFKDLGGAEKLWVVLHPFAAGKAYNISKDVEELCQEMIEKEQLDADGAGGKIDAFRHAYWMAILTKELGPARARWLGKAHEKKNKKDFEKGRLEDGAVPDKVSKEMDLFNNEVGIEIGEEYENASNEQLKQIILEKLEEGEMLIIKKDRRKNSLDENGKVIPNENWERSWENERVLVPSNFIQR